MYKNVHEYTLLCFSVIFLLSWNDYCDYLVIPLTFLPFSLLFILHQTKEYVKKINK